MSRQADSLQHLQKRRHPSTEHWRSEVRVQGYVAANGGGNATANILLMPHIKVSDNMAQARRIGGDSSIYRLSINTTLPSHLFNHHGPST